jgi:hypothetical protein
LHDRALSATYKSADPSSDQLPERRAWPPIGRVYSDEFRAALDSDPEDSQYELPALRDADGPIETLPAASDRASFDDPFLKSIDQLPSGEYELAIPRTNLGFVDTWARWQFFGALGFGILSTSFFGFCLARFLSGANTLVVPSAALLTGAITSTTLSLALVLATSRNLSTLRIARGMRRHSRWPALVGSPRAVGLASAFTARLAQRRSSPRNADHNFRA